MNVLVPKADPYARSASRIAIARGLAGQDCDGGVPVIRAMRVRVSWWKRPPETSPGAVFMGFRNVFGKSAS